MTLQSKLRKMMKMKLKKIINLIKKKTLLKTLGILKKNMKELLKIKI